MANTRIAPALTTVYGPSASRPPSAGPRQAAPGPSGRRTPLDAGILRPPPVVERHLTDPRTGRNFQFALPDLFRQSIYSRLAGYEDMTTPSGWPGTPPFGCWPRASGGRRASRSPRRSIGSRPRCSPTRGTTGGSHVSIRSCSSTEHLILASRSGVMTHAEAKNGLTLFAKEVLPRLREVVPPE